MINADITFIGQMAWDIVHLHNQQPRTAPGSAVLCGAMAAAKTGARIAVVTRMSPGDDQILGPMRSAGIECTLVPAEKTTRMVVIHRSENVDEREVIQEASAGFFTLDDIPELASAYVHLAGMSDQEFSFDFIKGLTERGYSLSADMQSFVRQVDPKNGQVAFNDVPRKQDIVACLARVKLDIVEAKALTGTDDLSTAARRIATWGCPEVIVTHAHGVLGYVEGKEYYEKFSNASTIGRTGRGDTTFGAYLARRLTHDPRESLKFAAELVSIKMETPGPFSGTLGDVLKRMKERHSAQ